MELTVPSPVPARQPQPGLVRYRLASLLVKGQPLGGTADEWVVIQPVHQAAGLAAALLGDDTPGTAPLFGRFSFQPRYQAFRSWVNGPPGHRLGLAPIPADTVTPQALRRTLALQLAHRPGGLLAAKIHLKHVSVATTEGRYPARAAPRPGCSPRSTPRRPNATSAWHLPSSATTSAASCPPGPAPGNSPRCSPASTPPSPPPSPAT